MKYYPSKNDSMNLISILNNDARAFTFIRAKNMNGMMKRTN